MGSLADNTHIVQIEQPGSQPVTARVSSYVDQPEVKSSAILQAARTSQRLTTLLMEVSGLAQGPLAGAPMAAPAMASPAPKAQPSASPAPANPMLGPEPEPDPAPYPPADPDIPSVREIVSAWDAPAEKDDPLFLSNDDVNVPDGMNLRLVDLEEVNRLWNEGDARGKRHVVKKLAGFTVKDRIKYRKSIDFELKVAVVKFMREQDGIKSHFTPAEESQFLDVANNIEAVIGNRQTYAKAAEIYNDSE